MITCETLPDSGLEISESVGVSTGKITGVIRNAEPLDYDRSHNHILSVVAYDCGMKRSAPVMVTIKVSRVCKLGWK
ncbi:unnamed protein product, partial [Allacma fusca]